MVIGPVSVDSVVDPLAGLSSLPETLGAPEISDRDHMDSIDTCFKSLALSNPQKLLEQAKTIFNIGSGLLNVKIPSPIAPKAKDEAVPVSTDVNSPSSLALKAKDGAIPVPMNARSHKLEEKIEAGPVQAHENQHERRAREGLGLNRKRARFSLKPNSSQPPSVSLEPSLEIDKLQDPNEYFLAYERLENARKELQKQNGTVLTDLGQVNSFNTERRRRPGLLGRSASFRHSYSSVAAHEDENFISSQETYQLDIQSQQSSDLDNTLLENEFPDSVANGKQIAPKLVDELLSKKCEGLEGDEVVNLVKGVLQIKPFDVAKVKSPLSDVLRSESKVSDGYLSKPRKALFDIQNVIGGVSNRTTVKRKHVGDTIADIPASSTPQKSPSVSMDSTPARYPPSGGNYDQPDEMNAKKELSVSGNMKQLLDEEGDTEAVKMGNSNRYSIGNGSSGSQGKPGTDMGIYDMKDLAIDNNSRRPKDNVEKKQPSELYNLINDMHSGFMNGAVINCSSSRPEADCNVHGKEPTEWHDPGNHVGGDHVSDMVVDSDSMRLHSDVQINECSASRDPQNETMDNDSNRLKADSNVHKNMNSELSDSTKGMVGDYIKDNVEKKQHLELYNLRNDMHSGFMNDMVMDCSSSRPEADSDVHGNEPTEWRDPGKHMGGDQMSGSKRLHSDVQINECSASPDPQNETMDNDSNRLNVHKNKNSELCDSTEGMVGEYMKDMFMDNASSRPEIDSDVQTNEHSKLHEKVGAMAHDTVVSAQSVENLNDTVVSAQSVDNLNDTVVSAQSVDNLNDTVVSAQSVENLNDSCALSGQFGPAVEPNTANGPSKTATINTGQPIQEPPIVEPQAPKELKKGKNRPRTKKRVCTRESQEPILLQLEAPKEPRKGKQPQCKKRVVSRRESQEPILQLEAPKEPRKGKQPPRKKREVSWRKSLEGAGMSWESGVRKSTRIKMRPLEYWKGERFLLGRIHESLTTVIGLKYASPTNKGKGEPTLRVKSYVSDEYKELVELAALH